MENLVKKSSLHGSSPHQDPFVLSSFSCSMKIKSKEASYFFVGCVTIFLLFPTLMRPIASGAGKTFISHQLCGRYRRGIPVFSVPGFRTYLISDLESLSQVSSAWIPLGLLLVSFLSLNLCPDQSVTVGGTREKEKWFHNSPFLCSLEKSLPD